MFNFRQAVWQHNECRLTGNISVRLWPSDRQPNTYRVDLFWQDAPGIPKVKLYSRYFQASNAASARSACGPVIRRWIAKQQAVPGTMYHDTWNDVREQFGLDRVPYGAQAGHPPFGKDTK